LKINYDKDINLFIWPEWGFSEKEVEIFLKNKFKKVFLWNRILRTETCPVATWFYIIQNK
jgi:RsmE family RNA methyltransferase